MDNEAKERKDRLIALGVVSLLMMIIYGPAMQFFVGTDRFLYDQLASRLPAASLSDSLIITIDASDRDASGVSDDYGRVLAMLKTQDAKRIVLPNPPPMDMDGPLPVWADKLRTGPPVFVPSRHPLAAATGRSGYVDLHPDRDGILRRSNLWYLNGGVMSPSLALAVALFDERNLPAANIARNDAAIYLTRYDPVPRLAAADVLDSTVRPDRFAGKTVFVDADLPLASAIGQLPSGQYVTPSEVSAAMLADIEAGRAITAPAWAGVMEILAPAILAVLAVLLLPGRDRRDIALITAGTIVLMIVAEVLLLTVVHLRFDFGRPILVFLGASAVTAALAGMSTRSTGDAFNRGNDFLAAGRLEPAFAEFRRCAPNDALANVLYKLSLAFEQQAKPERAEAVLNWMKQSQPASRNSDVDLKGTDGTPRRLGRYVIEKKLGRGAMGAVYLARDPPIKRAV
ncbi:MAG: CHASE2 domain-containing protein, partial [Woeseia sp.]